MRNEKPCQCACARYEISCTPTSMLPAAISCSLGFQTCERAWSISVMCARPRRPSLSPRRVASSSPPAPPPTITTRCSPLRSGGAAISDEAWLPRAGMSIRCLALQRFTNAGLRFSTNAAMPSFWSAVREERMEDHALEAQTLGERRLEGAVDRLLGHHHTRQRKPRSSSAAPRASSISLSAGTTRDTSPARSASARIHHAAVRTMSIALALPRARGRRCVPPAPGMTPSLISGWPNFGVVGGDHEVAHHAPARSRRPARSRPPRRSPACGSCVIVSQLRVM